MKKRVIFFLLLLTLPSASAIILNLNENYQPGETLIGSIEGNFLTPLTTDNFYFYSERVQIPVIFDVTRIRDKYYFYAVLPVNERNYSLILRNLHYFENNLEQTSDLEKNFAVSGNVTDFSVSPGVLVIRNESILTVESKNRAISVSAKFLNSTQNLAVPAGQKRKITFSSAGISEFKFTEIEVSALNTKYLVPAAIIPPALLPEQQNVTETVKLRFLLSNYSFSVYEKESTKFKLELVNTGDKPAKKIKLSYSDNLKGVIALNPAEIESLETDLKRIEIIINAPEVKILKGTIFANFENYSAQTSLTINSQSRTKPLPTVTEKSCTEMNGTICLENEKCAGILQDSLEGKCCIGTCEKKKSYTGPAIGIILLLIIIAIIYFLYKKSRKGKMTPEELLKQKQEKFEQRVSSVTNKLTRT